MFWKKKKQISPLEEDFTFPQPINQRTVIFYPFDEVFRFATTAIPAPAQCLECDGVEITEHGDTYRRFKCVNCGRTFSTGERAPATGKTARLERHCTCGEAMPNEAAFCIFCGAATV